VRWENGAHPIAVSREEELGIDGIKDPLWLNVFARGDDLIGGEFGPINNLMGGAVIRSRGREEETGRPDE
jgi:hypothetical protein